MSYGGLRRMAIPITIGRAKSVRIVTLLKTRASSELPSAIDRPTGRRCSRRGVRRAVRPAGAGPDRRAGSAARWQPRHTKLTIAQRGRTPGERRPGDRRPARFGNIRRGGVLERRSQDQTKGPRHHVGDRDPDHPIESDALAGARPETRAGRRQGDHEGVDKQGALPQPGPGRTTATPAPGARRGRRRSRRSWPRSARQRQQVIRLDGGERIIGAGCDSRRTELMPMADGAMALTWPDGWKIRSDSRKARMSSAAIPQARRLRVAVVRPAALVEDQMVAGGRATVELRPPVPEIVRDLLHVRLIAKSPSKGIDRALRVVAGTVEAQVHDRLGLAVVRIEGPNATSVDAATASV